MDIEKSQFNNKEFAPWQKGAAFNAYWTYSFVSNSSFFAKIRGVFKPFMNKCVQNWLWWYDGWVPYFHDAERGIMCTGLAKAIVDRTAKKVSGSRIMYKNAFKERGNEKGTEVNPALKAIAQWADDTNFTRTVKMATRFALAAGTALVKINRDAKGQFTTEAVRFDRFLPCVDNSGKLQEVTIYLLANIPLSSEDESKQNSVYTLEERRYYGCYTKADGKTVIHDAPICEYQVHEYTKPVNNGVTTSSEYVGRVNWKSVPSQVRKVIRDNYGVIIDKPFLLPFTDLGCELVTSADCVGNYPDLPFGESLLANIIPHLQEYDYYHSAMCTDMYLGRGKVLLPKGISGTGSNSSAYNGLDETLYDQIPHTNPDEQQPIPIQFELRAAEWQVIRNTIIENIAINTGLSSTTIASFLNDNSAKTAREISTEENETAGFVDDMRAVIEAPLNRIIDRIRLAKGLADKVVIRWSNASLQNKYTTAETLNLARQGGYISQYKAVQMFNSDDDDIQVQEEYDRIKAEEPQGYDDTDSGDYFGMGGDVNVDTETQSTGESNNGLPVRD